MQYIKKYNNRWVIKDVSQTFCKGGSFVFLGHNGCGKSTLLRLISGLTPPDQGKVCYGKPLRFSFVPEKFRPVPLSGRTYLKHMGELDGIHGPELHRKIEKSAEDFFLSEMLDIPMQSMSKGTLQKIGVIQALLKAPDVLLLDEPLSGQDTASQKVFTEKVNQLRERGVTVFISCHERWLVKALSDYVFIIKNSKLVPYKEEKRKFYTLLWEKPEHADV